MTEELKNYLITVASAQGYKYTWPEERSLEEGEWFMSPLNRKGNNQASGIVESIYQSDYCPQAFYENIIIHVKIKRLGDG